MLAAKLVGRWRSGAPLTLAPEVDDPTLGADPQRNNDFNYSKDPHGRRVPFGCHIRRMNPRDTELTRLTDVNLHRLISRGTTYGPPYDRTRCPKRTTRCRAAPIFLFISAKAMATIEFLQQEWINDGNFMGIGDERDPIIGRQEEGAAFTIPRIRLDDASMGSRRSTCSAAVSTSSCRACPRSSGYVRSAEMRGSDEWQHGA